MGDSDALTQHCLRDLRDPRLSLRLGSLQQGPSDQHWPQQVTPRALREHAGASEVPSTDLTP